MKGKIFSRKKSHLQYIWIRALSFKPKYLQNTRVRKRLPYRDSRTGTERGMVVFRLQARCICTGVYVRGGGVNFIFSRLKNRSALYNYCCAIL
jgi:hypothetical protein